jgi:hypothetical protein
MRETEENGWGSANPAGICFLLSGFWEFVSDFVLRISDFPISAA